MRMIACQARASVWCWCLARMGSRQGAASRTMDCTPSLRECLGGGPAMIPRATRLKASAGALRRRGLPRRSQTRFPMIGGLAAAVGVRHDNAFVVMFSARRARRSIWRRLLASGRDPGTGAFEKLYGLPFLCILAHIHSSAASSAALPSASHSFRRSAYSAGQQRSPAAIGHPVPLRMPRARRSRAAGRTAIA